MERNFGACLIKRRKKRNALQMIPMKVSEKDVHVRFVGLLQLKAEVTDPGARVKDE